jgi:SAM-dependent methyltransferase
VPVEGYTAQSYGDRMADVYDEWYHGISDVDDTIALLGELAGAGAVLELGVGTGRLAIPLARHGIVVTGIDTSEQMLAKLRAKPGADRVDAVIGDITKRLPGGPYQVIFVAYNTLFAIDSDDDYTACFGNVAAALVDGGRFVVEAFVPRAPDVSSSVEVKTVTADRVVLSVSVFSPDDQRAHGQFVEFSEAGGVILRPWAVRYQTPAQLDAFASAAGLNVENRYASWQRQPFTATSERHVSIYRKSP